MELLACVLKYRQQDIFCAHKQVLLKWVPEIYKTQETLPRILSIYWNMVPTDFIQSFDQELQCSIIPLRTAGPMIDKTTWSAWLFAARFTHNSCLAMGWLFVYMCFMSPTQNSTCAKMVGKIYQI